jgi:predicted Zn-dependent peptidase
VVAVPQPQLHRAHVALYVRVGSRFESKTTNGLSHFLEHMLYRGTAGLPTAHDVNMAFERLGGYLYAATQTDFSVFSVTLPPECLDDACALFADVLTGPTFADIGIEKEIVCEEILEDLDDEGRQVDAENLSRMLIYPTHPLGYTITGDADTVRSFDERMLRAHHGRHYTAAASVLAFSGAIDSARVMDVAEKHFARLPRGTPIAAEAPVHAQKRARLKIVDNQSSQTELRVCLRAVSEKSADRPATDMLMRIIDDGMSTRLYHRICDAQGLCYDVSAGFDGYEDDGVIDFAAGVQHARTARVTKEILALLEELAREGPTEEELAKARRRNAWEANALLDSAEDLAGFFAGGYLFDRFETPAERLAKNAAVTAEDVKRMAQKLARPDRLNVLAVGILEDGEDKRLGDVVKGWAGATTG